MKTRKVQKVQEGGASGPEMEAHPTCAMTTLAARIFSLGDSPRRPLFRCLHTPVAHLGCSLSPPTRIQIPQGRAAEHGVHQSSVWHMARFHVNILLSTRNLLTQATPWKARHSELWRTHKQNILLKPTPKQWSSMINPDALSENVFLEKLNFYRHSDYSWGQTKLLKLEYNTVFDV